MSKEFIYVVADDHAQAARVVDTLRGVGLGDDAIHAVASDRQQLADLPDADLTAKSDVVPAMERGLAAGGAAGLLAGLAAVTFPPAGLALGGGAVLVTGLAGAGVGAFFASLIGVSVTNTELQAYQEALDAGKILILAELDADRAEAVETEVRREVPGVEVTRQTSGSHLTP